MIEHLNDEEQKWLFAETRAAVARTLPTDAQCLVPKCGNGAIGVMALFSVPTRFSTELPLCDRCYKAITQAQMAVFTAEQIKSGEEFVNSVMNRDWGAKPTGQ